MKGKHSFARRASIKSRPKGNHDSVSLKTIGSTQSSSVTTDFPEISISNSENGLEAGLNNPATKAHEEPSPATPNNDGFPMKSQNGDEQLSQEERPQRYTQFSATRVNRDVCNDEPPFGTKIYSIWPSDVGWNDKKNQRIDNQLLSMVGAHRMFVCDTETAGVNFWRASLSMAQAELLRAMPEVWNNQVSRSVSATPADT
ncbi:hypothetical protein PG996_010819 [Apiospora saccharicola]|uniref:3'-5' exonuclease domain-containing protein n=1 Tax=Apiospora saccharicola TaxID=335842 RepID=A0ABR1USR9_9PEZI